MSLISKIESILFVSSESVSLAELKKLCDVNKQEVEKALLELREKYNADKNNGIIFIESFGKFQLVSHPDNAQIVKDFLKSGSMGELSDPSLETLTIIAYRGPITKPQLEQIRGINCSLILRNLLIRGLIERVDDKRGDLPKYCVTNEFIKFLGVSSVSELADYQTLSKHETLDMALRSDEIEQSSDFSEEAHPIINHEE